MNDQQLIVRSLLVLIKLDAEALYDRLKYNFREYMQIFANKRTREHFKDVLRTRFFDVPITDLKYLSEDLLLALDKFYKEVDALKWYLNATEDMPATVEDRVVRVLRDVQMHYDVLRLYLEAELGHVGVAPTSPAQEDPALDPFKIDLPES
ncbi:MAG: hypothetical protein A2X86_18205 [Bdellovibrionales bacterium GWA2_49_15]|nr:MAG: hypothetical protein A2X86_18205 [Bdellovibrionales bacterium GWA2_49_15]HAZ11657.1 hypothetical protein [Bdellovibrionales bacterium]